MAAISRQDSAQRRQISAHCLRTVCMSPSCAAAMRSHSAAHASQTSAQTRRFCQISRQTGFVGWYVKPSPPRVASKNRGL